jgi:acetyltransferase
MKGEKLGLRLMNKMIDYCRNRGTIEMIGSVLPDNGPMLGLARKLGFKVEYNEDEEVMDLRLPLNSPTDDWERETINHEEDLSI